MELDQRQLAEQLLAQAKEQGVGLVGPNGLLKLLTKNMLETALDAEMAEHLGYDKHDRAGSGSGNSRNGTRARRCLSSALWLPDALTCNDTSWLPSSTRGVSGVR